MAAPLDPSTILHISTEAEWVAARGAGEVRTSTRDRSLAEEGFIHCSSDDQVLGVASAFYADLDEPLVVLRIAVERLQAPVRWENLDGGADSFPHVYGPVPVDAVVSVSLLRRGDDGAFVTDGPREDARMSVWPSPDRIEPPQVSGERASLDAWVDYHRATLLMKCAGLEPERLVERSCPPSTLSLLGLVRHLTEVEGWFHDFDGEPAGDWYSSEEDPDACFDAVDASQADANLAAYRASVDRARAAVEHRQLDEISPEPDDGRPVSLRWIYLHMIEEYARHNGHADILRERIDGATGD